MKNSEIVEKINAFEERLKAFGDVGTKVAEIDGYITRARNDADETAKARSDIVAIKQEVDSQKSAITEAITEANAYKEEIDKQKAVNKSLTERLQKLSEDIGSLKKEAENQLGSISAKVLSNSFDNVAIKLEKSVFSWKISVAISIVVLFCVTLAVIIWELWTGGTISITNSGFLLKATLTSPFIFLVGFTVRQYSREKKLFDEYTFKSAVALSFEAFRKLIKEEDSQVTDHRQIVNFIIKTVSSIYSTPIDSSEKNEELEDISSNLDNIAKASKGSLPLIK